MALDLPHIAAKDHGFDVVGIYRSSTGYGVSFVESKAYERIPNGAINDAVAFYLEIESGKHDARARQVVASIRESLPPQSKGSSPRHSGRMREPISPNPHFHAEVAMDWMNSRPSFGKLNVPKERIVVMPHAIAEFPRFFDDVAAAMLKLATELAHA